MSERTKALPDLIPNIGFNSISQEQFVQEHSIIFEHWAAIPSPIGLKDRGEYRRSDSLDTISSNGFLYRKVGEFTGILVNNSRKNNHTEANNIYDSSTARLVLPKYYNANCPSSSKEISLLPGDRIYAKDIELKVDNYQRVEYRPSAEDILQFPVKCVSMLIDSQNNEYTEGKHFKINSNGNIKWIDGQNNPGIDVETGKGRVYSIRYTYLAYWYIFQLVNEIRITNNGNSSTPNRMPYQAIVQREYVYHNQNRGDLKESENIKDTDRTNTSPDETISPNKTQVHVDIKNFT